MTSRTNRDSPRLLGRGPVVHAEHRMTLPNRRGILEAGFLSPQYRPFPQGAHVVLDCGTGNCMTVHHARMIGQSLAHCGQITVTGTDDRSERGYVDHGLIFGLDAIANTISRYAHEFATESRT